MKDRRSRAALLPVVLLLGLGLCLCLALPAGAAEFERRFAFDGNELTLINLIGEVEIAPARDNRFEVEVRVRGEDAEEHLIEFREEQGPHSTLAILFPLEETRTYIYPPMGRRSSTTFTMPGKGDGRGALNELLRILAGKKIKVRGSGGGMELWADVTVRIPAGSRLSVEHGVGQLSASNVSGDLELDLASGSVTIQKLEGDLMADTGSGSVQVREARGDLSIDTGSGHVTVLDCRASRVRIDTGSGGVTAEALDCRDLRIDTGSGGVEAQSIAADEAVIDTGSGSVELELVRMGKGRFRIDTGSGSINLTLPEDASARITADTGSGSVHADFEGARVRRSDHASFTVGDGDAEVVLETGSGSIRIRS